MKRSIHWTNFLSFTISCLATAPLAVNAADHLQPPSTPDPIAIYREAGASDDQLKKILRLANEYEKTEDEKAHVIIAELKRMRSLSLSPDVDGKAVIETQTKINTLQSDMALDKVNLLIKIRAILNKEQRIKLVELLQKQRHPNE